MFETARSAATPAEILEANAFIVQEAITPRFGAALSTAVDSEVSPAADDGMGSSRHRDTLIRAPMPKLPDLTRNPLGLAPEAIEPELTNELDDANAPSAIVPMFRPTDLDGNSALEAPVKLAGVSK